MGKKKVRFSDVVITIFEPCEIANLLKSTNLCDKKTKNSKKNNLNLNSKSILKKKNNQTTNNSFSK